MSLNPGIIVGICVLALGIAGCGATQAPADPEPVADDGAIEAERCPNTPGTNRLHSATHLLRWSPDGSTLAYSRRDHPEAQLYVLDVNAARSGDSVAPRLLASDAWPFDWSPDGDAIVYTALDQLAFVDVEQGTISTITGEFGTMYVDASWSPDGESVAYLQWGRSQDAAGRQENGIWRLDPATVNDPVPLRARIYTQQQLIGEDKFGFRAIDRFDGPPEWSPDGARLAFLAQEAVLVLDIAASEHRQVSPEDHCATAPGWSPDGTHVAYLTIPHLSDFRSEWSLGVTPIPGGEPVIVVDAEELRVQQFAWSPDGEALAFVGIRGDDREDRPDIYVVGRDGTGLTQLTDTPDVLELAVDWSPDGAQLALVASQDGAWHLDLIDLDTNAQTTLAELRAW